MTKDEMVQGVLRACGISKANVERFYDGLSALAQKELKAKGEFVLPGLGVLRVVTRKARMGRNPRTGEPIHIPRKKAVRFRAYKGLRELLNPGSTPQTPPAGEEEACSSGDDATPCES